MPKLQTRIMYIEDKSEGFNGPARIGRVTLSKTGRSVHYQGRTFRKAGGGYKYNYIAEDNGAHFWISGPRRDGADRLYPKSRMPVEIDADVADEYWRDIRSK
ncbi:1-deoxy-D-xylulose-5-phosphate synthase [Sphingomonas sp. ST-64]|uniref:1-deoxy-D-xylulose-5-phosphate synthase n=1 Tax=Sphingomonas plantiphila TaxID=3163295 RepID=A0ABW8YRV0_9SPHN